MEKLVWFSSFLPSLLLDIWSSSSGYGATTLAHLIKPFSRKRSHGPVVLLLALSPFRDWKSPIPWKDFLTSNSVVNMMDIAIANNVFPRFHVPETKRLQEIVVPSSYTTKSGALNKSRALQYCLEDDVNILGDDDWIIHLDEETLLTESSVKGILNFITEGKYDFGQGLITYANTPVHFRSWWKSFQNRICTVADSFRVADDLGKIRFQFKTFHAPIFGWKGSYVVTRVTTVLKHICRFNFLPCLNSDSS